MNIENYVQAVVQYNQTCNGRDYMTAVASAETFLELIYRDDAEKLRKIKDEIVKLKTKNDSPRNICKSCKIEMDYYDDGMLICPQCDRVIEDDLSCVLTHVGYIDEPTKPQFNPNKHFAEWLNQILGWAMPKDFVDVLNKIRQYIAQNNINEISPESLRKILKDLKLSKNYKYTSFLYKELTDIGPPKIPEEIIRRANFLFNEYIKTRKKYAKKIYLGVLITHHIRISSTKYSMLFYRPMKQDVYFISLSCLAQQR